MSAIEIFSKVALDVTEDRLSELLDAAEKTAFKNLQINHSDSNQASWIRF